MWNKLSRILDISTLHIIAIIILYVNIYCTYFCILFCILCITFEKIKILCPNIFLPVCSFAPPTERFSSRATVRSSQRPDVCSPHPRGKFAVAAASTQFSAQPCLRHCQLCRWPHLPPPEQQLNSWLLPPPLSRAGHSWEQRGWSHHHLLHAFQFLKTNFIYSLSIKDFPREKYVSFNSLPPTLMTSFCIRCKHSLEPAAAVPRVRAWWQRGRGLLGEDSLQPRVQRNHQPPHLALVRPGHHAGRGRGAWLPGRRFWVF